MTITISSHSRHTPICTLTSIVKSAETVSLELLEALYPTATGFVHEGWNDIIDKVKAGTCRGQVEWLELTRRHPNHLQVDLGNVPWAYEHIPIYPEIIVPYKFYHHKHHCFDVARGASH